MLLCDLCLLAAWRAQDTEAARLTPLGVPRRVGTPGRVAEWLKAPVLKTGVRESVPGVRIPPRPLWWQRITSIAVTVPNRYSLVTPHISNTLLRPYLTTVFMASDLSFVSKVLLGPNCPTIPLRLSRVQPILQFPLGKRDLDLRQCPVS